MLLFDAHVGSGGDLGDGLERLPDGALGGAVERFIQLLVEVLDMVLDSVGHSEDGDLVRTDGTHPFAGDVRAE